MRLALKAKMSSRASLETLAGFLAVGALAAGGCGSGGQSTGSDPPPDAPAATHIALSDLERCTARHLPAGMLCGRTDLPLERADQSLGSTSIAFAVLPREDRSTPAKGAVIAIEGGPGYGSIESAKTYVKLLGGRLRHRDLLLVDARGTGASEAIDCPDLQSGRADDAIGLGECARKLGPRFDSYRTSAAADDINSIRNALGYDDVQVYGDSYGTYLAQSYAFRHPDGLSALVLDSAFPVRGESGWYPSIWRTGIGGLQVACRRSPACHGDAGARLDRMVAELRADGLGVGPLLDQIGSAGFSPPDSYLKIDAAISAYLRGDREPYEVLTSEERSGYGNPRNYSRGEELVVSCNDYPMIWDKDASEAERRRQLDARIRAYPKDAFAPFTPREVALTNHVLYLECLAAPRPGALYEPAADPAAKAPDVPTLVVSGELDDVTSPAEGRAVAEEFPDSRLFRFRNAGHVYSEYGADNPGARRIRTFLARHGGDE